MFRRSLTALVAFAFVFLGVPLGARHAAAEGTISLTTIGSAYTQNFDTLASAANATSNVTPNGWALSETGTNANDTYGVSTGSSNTGNTYSFGAASNTERAFGGLQSGSLNPTIGASFTNNTSSDLTLIDVRYVGEQWRVGTLGRADRIDFQWSANATSLTTGTWTDVDALDFTGPVTTGVVGLLDGNLAANQTVVSGSIVAVIPIGTTFWIRWSSFDASGADDGLAVDVVEHAGERDEGERHRVEHQLDAHEHHQRVAPHHQPDGADAEQQRPEHQVPGGRDLQRGEHHALTSSRSSGASGWRFRS